MDNCVKTCCIFLFVVFGKLPLIFIAADVKFREKWH